MEMEVEYLIVGAGPAGALAGYLLQQAGKDVLIIDRADLSKKNKLCGGLISDKAYEILIAHYPKEEIKLLFRHYFDHYYVKTNFTQQQANNITLRVVKRKDLDFFLVNKYTSIGGKILEKTIISDINFEENIVQAGDLEIRYQNLIGADGVFSLVRRKLTGEKQSVRLCIESFPEVVLNISGPIVEFKPGYPGYNLVVPLKDCTLLCTGVDGIGNKQRLLEELESLRKQISADSLEWRGGFVPSGDNVLLEHKGVFFIGDAAGLIHPMTGEGIYYALYSAERLVESFLNKDVIYKFSMQDLLNNISIWRKRTTMLSTLLCKNPMAISCLAKKSQGLLKPFCERYLCEYI